MKDKIHFHTITINSAAFAAIQRGRAKHYEAGERRENIKTSTIASDLILKGELNQCSEK